MSQKSKVTTKSGGTWHHLRAIQLLLNNWKQPWGCNQVNLVKALRYSLVKSIKLGTKSLILRTQEDGQPN